ncbi:MAG: glycosyltransferase [Candidatus Gastranaerophilaceae bacterium]
MPIQRPEISIIIPFYNADNQLRQCLNSVVNQTLTNLEIICIDDNSRDKSLKIAEEFAKTDNRIKIIKNEETKGQSYSRNRGLEAATGRYIGFVDADDFISENMYKTMYEKARKNQADIVMCKALLYDEKTQTTKNDDYYELKCVEDFFQKTFSHEDTKNFITEINVAVWNKLYRKDFLQSIKANFVEGSIFEDLPFFFESYTKAKNVVIVDEHLYYYRINTPNSTMTQTGKKLLDRVEMVTIANEVLKKLPYYEEIKTKVLDWIIHDIFYRFLAIDSKYQREYFFKMQKLFRSLDISKKEKSLIETPYLPFFDEIKEKSFIEVINNFIKLSLSGVAYIEKTKEETKNRLKEINRTKKEIEQYHKEINKIKKETEKKFKITNRLKEEINELIAEIKEGNEILIKDSKSELEKEQEYYQELMKKQLELQKENYEKIMSFKNKIEETPMSRPKVSIILPVYNVAPYLRQSLDSIIAQTLKEIEIICVDDGSTDDSGKILDEYQAKDRRIKVLHKKNAGTGAARNDGLRMATGECIGFVDPDDWILPNMYERLYGILQEKKLDIVMFTPDVYNDKTKKHEGFLYFQDSNFPSFLDNKIFNKDDISPFSYPMCVWNKLYTKKLFDDNNIDFAEGLDFEDHKCIFKTLFTAKRIYFIREKLYVYRHSREGSILSDNDTRMFDHIKIYDVVENVLKETGNWEKFRLDFLRYKVHNILYYYTMIKPQYKKDYYNKMVKSLHATKMSNEEIELLGKDYPELKRIMNDTLANKLKKAVNIIMKKEDIKD